MAVDGSTERHRTNLLVFPRLCYPQPNIARPTLYSIYDTARTWSWSEEREKNSTKFQFLANFTSTTGMVNSFDCCSIDERVELLEIHHSPNSHFHTTGREALPPAMPRHTSQPHTTNELGPQGNHIWGYILDRPTPPASEESMHLMADIQVQYTQDWMMLRSPTKPLAGNTKEPESSRRSMPAGTKVDSAQAALELQRLTSTGLRIVSRIKEVTMVKPRNSIVNLNWTSHVEAACLEFFSGTNISRFLNLFWAGWYPNWPVIHKPTFNLSTTMDILVAAMVVIGKSRLINLIRPH